MSPDDTGDSVAIQLSENMNGTIRNVFVYKAEYFVFLIEYRPHTRHATVR